MAWNIKTHEKDMIQKNEHLAFQFSYNFLFFLHVSLPNQPLLMHTHVHKLLKIDMCLLSDNKYISI